MSEFAFPQFDWHVVIDRVSHGMSLRDYFAGQALVMAGAQIAARSTLDPQSFDATSTIDGVAEAAYAIADAMLKERHK